MGYTVKQNARNLIGLPIGARKSKTVLLYCCKKKKNI